MGLFWAASLPFAFCSSSGFCDGDYLSEILCIKIPILFLPPARR